MKNKLNKISKRSKTNKRSVLKGNIKALSKLLLIFMLVFSITLPVFAAGIENEKEEVVYGMLNNDGSSQEVYVVNIFDSKGEILDYGDYTEVRNMKSDDEVKIDKNKVRADNTHDKLYYEGSLKNKELPWNIRIRYFIDNEELSAEDLGGKSGDLRIEMLIEENKNTDNFFYKNYALQATVVLNAEKASAIKSDGATIVNAGKEKHLTYTILPGKGAEISIEADVTDFEMEAIAVNGINLNLDIDLDDEALMERAEELLKGVNRLDKGTHDVKEGALNLKAGTGKLNKGAEKIKTGTSDLDNGISSLKNGIKEIDNALEQLNSKSDDLTKGSGEFKSALGEIKRSLSGISVQTERISELTDASSKIKSGINEMNYSLKLLNENTSYNAYKAGLKSKGLDIEELKKGNDRALGTLKTTLEKLNEVSAKAGGYSDNPELAALKKEIDSQIENIASLEVLFKGNNASISGTEMYLDEISDAVSEIYKGSSGLNLSYGEFDSAVLELAESLNAMTGKLPELKGAIDLLEEKYSQFDEGLNNYTDGVKNITIGYKSIVKGTSNLSAGSSSLKTGSDMLYDNMSELLKGTSDLYHGTEKLAEGTEEFKDKTSNLDGEIQKEIDETLLEITGDASETISFVSDKNKNIKSVQFIMKTNDIKFKDQIDNLSKDEPKKLTFWDKLKNLINFTSN